MFPNPPANPIPQINQDAPVPQADPAVPALALNQFLNELDGLTFALNQRLPALSEQCSKCNELLRKNPELFHLLKDEQIHALMSGVIANSETEFAVGSAGKKTGAAKDILKGVRLDAIKDADVGI